MTKIQLEFECTAPNDKCFYRGQPNECLVPAEESPDGHPWRCSYLKAKAIREREKASQKHGGE